MLNFYFPHTIFGSIYFLGEPKQQNLCLLLIYILHMQSVRHKTLVVVIFSILYFNAFSLTHSWNFMFIFLIMKLCQKAISNILFFGKFPTFVPSIYERKISPPLDDALVCWNWNLTHARTHVSTFNLLFL